MRLPGQNKYKNRVRWKSEEECFAGQKRTSLFGEEQGKRHYQMFPNGILHDPLYQRELTDSNQFKATFYLWVLRVLPVWPLGNSRTWTQLLHAQHTPSPISTVTTEAPGEWGTSPFRQAVRKVVQEVCLPLYLFHNQFPELYHIVRWFCSQFLQCIDPKAGRAYYEINLLECELSEVTKPHKNPLWHQHFLDQAVLISVLLPSYSF